LDGRPVFLDIREDDHLEQRKRRALELHQNQLRLEESLRRFVVANPKFQHSTVASIGLHADDLLQGEVFWDPDGYTLLKGFEFVWANRRLLLTPIQNWHREYIARLGRYTECFHWVGRRGKHLFCLRRWKSVMCDRPNRRISQLAHWSWHRTRIWSCNATCCKRRESKVHRLGPACNVGSPRCGRWRTRGTWLQHGTPPRFLGQSTLVDSTWRSWSGALYDTESKFGMSTLTKPQQRAAKAFGDAYHVERWGYDIFSRAGSYFGATGTSVVQSASDECGCKRWGIMNPTVHNSSRKLIANSNLGDFGT